jgi:hypothetical protein
VTLQNSFRWARQPQVAGLAVGDLQTGKDRAWQPQAAGLAVGDLQTGRDRARQATAAGWGGSLLSGVGISFKPWPWGGLWAVVSLPVHI